MKTKKSWVEQFDKEFIQDRKQMTVFALENEIKFFIGDLLDKNTKSFGGCTNCYGKGFSTEKTSITAFADFEGDKDHRTELMNYNLCSCDRGKQISRVLDSQRKELLSKLPKEMSERIEVNPDFVRTGYNQCLSEVRDIITKKENK